MNAPTRLPSQSELWNGPAAQAWIAGQRILDTMFAPVAEHLARTIPIGADWKVLDVGCGTGTTTLAAAARLGTGGHCTGVDLSAPMIEVAKTRAADAGLPVDFIAADAGNPPLPAGSIDHIISRFGVTFFDAPVRAFGGLRSVTRPGGTVYAIAWRSATENPFMTTAERTAAPWLDLPPRAPTGPGQFAFADPDKVRSVLEAAGWGGVAVDAWDVACAFDRADLRSYLSLLGPVGIALRDASLEPALRKQVLQRLEAAFAPFVDGDRVRYTAACWIARATAP